MEKENRSLKPTEVGFKVHDFLIGNLASLFDVKFTAYMEEELDEIDRRLLQLKIEAEALKKEKDAASKDRLNTLEEEIAELQAHSDELTTAWSAEKMALWICCQGRTS